MISFSESPSVEKDRTTARGRGSKVTELIIMGFNGIFNSVQTKCLGLKDEL